MQKKFLEDVADKMIAMHGNDFSQVAVVLPANRAKLFLKKYLNEKSQKALWAPRCFVLPELVQWLSEKKISSSLDQTIALYEAYQKATAQPQAFETFCSWAPTVLNDFNDADQYLVDAKSLFTNLRNIEYVEHWSLRSEKLSTTQERYLTFWEDLGKTYFALQQESETYKAQSYASLTRWIASHTPLVEAKLKNLTVWFAGLASLSPAEDAFVKMIGGNCTTKIMWDTDDYYLKDEMNNAGSFLRKYSALNHIPIPSENILDSAPKSFHLNETTTPSGEVFAAANKLMQMSSDELNKTAIVLADPSLAEALMDALPLLDVPVNLAMGLPLRSHSLNKWMVALLKIKSNAKQDGVHHKELIEWLHLSTALGVSQSFMIAIRKEISNQNLIYIKTEKCKSLLERNEITAQWTALIDAVTPIDLLQNASLILKDRLKQKGGNSVTQVVIEKLLSCMEELESVAILHPFANSYEALERLWHQVISKEQVQFQGEPVHGVQVLSMVETRALDFENILLLGANEDTLPGNAPTQTFIPWDVRHELNMPLPDDRESAFAYTFYRMIQRATNIHFYYSSISSDFKGTEQSRYIQQLQNELLKKNEKATWVIQKYRFEEEQKVIVAEFMPNDDFAKQRLDALFAAGISPSAIGKFNRCPLDFYYRYIIGLGEAEEVEEQIGAATFGSVVHDVLEKFYGRFKNSYPQKEDYSLLKDYIAAELTQAFSKLYSAENIQTGYNALAFSIAEEMLYKFIAHELKLSEERESMGIQPILLDVEFALSREVDIHKYDGQKPIRMRGKGDRIEEVAGKIHILDYKTGKVKKQDYVLSKNLDEVFTKEDSGKLIQLLSYIYMYCANGADGENVSAAFYSFQNHSSGYSYLQSEKTTNQLLQEFEAALVQWVKSVYQLETFEHDADSKYCQYCSMME